jgi:hypothetical protein
MPIVGQFGSLAGFGVFPGGALESIATITVGSGGASSIEFASIPSGFQHLQIRMIARETGTATTGGTDRVRFNDDTGNNYAWHYLYGSGIGAVAGASSSTNATYATKFTGGGQTASAFGATVIDILDYASTSKTKVLRMLGGNDANGSGTVDVHSGLWNSTSAITKITLDKFLGGSWAQYTTAALYGVRG